MPEGPSIVILKESVQALQLEGQPLLSVSGTASIDFKRIRNQKLRSFNSWGKHFLICFDDCTIRIHLLMFGSYRINERKDSKERLSLVFKDAELNFYTCSVKLLEGRDEDLYDWSSDIMSRHWAPARALEKLQAHPDALLCDALLDQDIFSGVGNIIKNEALYRSGLQPYNTVAAVPVARLRQLIGDTRRYSADFLHWKKEGTLKAHWAVHTKKVCPKGHTVLKEYTGKTKRRSFFCPLCQELYRDGVGKAGK
ncbi:MAG: endonuclease [Chitinophagaceae bacterium]|nr:endonuclease [Chitinophagaceae bacterium]